MAFFLKFLDDNPDPNAGKRGVVDYHIPHVAPLDAVWKTIFGDWEKKWCWIKVDDVGWDVDEDMKRPTEKFPSRTPGDNPDNNENRGPDDERMTVLIQIRCKIEPS